MKENIIKTKSYLFAIEVIKTSKKMMAEEKEFVLSKQLLRSGTSIGAMVREAEQAQSKRDFIHKLSIALKEANETDYWIDLIKETSNLKEKEVSQLKNSILEILKLLTKIIKTSKTNLASI